MTDTPGTILKQLRKDRRLTQAEVAEAVGIERQTLSGIEGDKAYAKPGRETAIALADFYGVPFDTIFRSTAPKVANVAQTPSEIELIRLWRRLDPAQKRFLAEMAESVSKVGASFKAIDNPQVIASNPHAPISKTRKR